MIVLALALSLLILEELLHRLNKGPSMLEFDLTGNSMPASSNEEKPWRIARLLSWIRVWELIVFGILFAIVAASSGIKVLSTASGNIAALLLLIQVARIVNRRVIRQWAVLGGAVILQAVLLIVIGLVGLGTPDFDPGHSVFPMDWLSSALSFLVVFILSLSIPFSGTYLLRLISREGSTFYYSQPPLAYSEYWIRRISREAARMNIVLLLLHIFLVISSGYPAGPMLLQLILGIFMIAALIDFRRTNRLYHSLGIALIATAWCFNILWFITGLNRASRGWFA